MEGVIRGQLKGEMGMKLTQLALGAALLATVAAPAAADSGTPAFRWEVWGLWCPVESDRLWRH